MKNNRNAPSRILAKVAKNEKVPKKIASPRSHASAKGYALCLRSSGGHCVEHSSGSLAANVASKGLGGQRNEGLPLEAWAGTMASEPKGTEPEEPKSSRAPKRGEEQG